MAVSRGFISGRKLAQLAQYAEIRVLSVLRLISTLRYQPARLGDDKLLLNCLCTLAGATLHFSLSNMNGFVGFCEFICSRGL